MKKKIIMALLAFIFIFQGNWLGARVYIDIETPSLSRLPIAVCDFKNTENSSYNQELGKEIAGIITNDLRISGFFRIIDPQSFIEDPQASGINRDKINFSSWSLIGAYVLVKGGFSYVRETLRMECRLFDVFQERLIVGKRYAGNKDKSENGNNGGKQKNR